MMLEGRIAIVYGAGGAVGAAVARAFAREGATVNLAGRTGASLDRVAGEIRAEGGSAETAVVDALDEAAVDAHADAVAATAGAIDISFNLIACGDVQGTPVVDMTVGDFMQPVVNRVRTQFLTARAAARHMVPRGSGVILTFGGPGMRDPIRDFYTGGYQVCLGGTQLAFGAQDVFRRQLAQELGPHGIRVVTLQSGGLPETIADEGFRAVLAESFRNTSMLKRTETLEDVGTVAAFAASDLARSMTATAFNITYGREAN
jgi:NAD(P)-dependent dehydrogenase (short-subunit alcohol dehydrogenase family)